MRFVPSSISSLIHHQTCTSTDCVPGTELALGAQSSAIVQPQPRGWGRADSKAAIAALRGHTGCGDRRDLVKRVGSFWAGVISAETFWGDEEAAQVGPSR